ncbi:uracil phosphoribosyltransferase [Algibacter miyuki]|uniref:Uracil phosphoribosyltransferase n=1 Tax=Algibacter miyuki TaxID=1306933 RepID=A0ABV5GVP4_9FLAO|nr:uracil phosphoribosyltransferase [Algibacter miyuki]MDN3664905.1 uracil phosphoribosyltransferase [Algibacter miyuki]
MKDFFYAIQDLFVDTLLVPMDALRALELENWFAASTISWIFAIIGLVAMVYWMLQLKKYSDNDEEDKSISAHSYL